MQSNFSPQTFNALLQQLQPSTDALQRQIPSIHAIDPNPPQQAGFTGFLQQQIPQASGASNFASQLFSDTLKMIAPVGQSPNDEQLLVMALQSGLNQGLDHRRAIERLHGVNNHAANLWKDYYLEHKSRIDDTVNQLQPIKTAKKPVRFDLGPKALSTPSEVKLNEPKRGRFANIGSLSVHRKFGSPRTHIIPRPPIPARRKHRSPSRHSDLPIPAPPEVEPTPPTEVVKSTMGNLFTVEEKKYFSKYISWALHLDPMLTKTQLTKKLAEKVPHHTANSWSSYWARDPLADRLLVAARESTIGGFQGRGSTGSAEKEEDYVEKDQETVEEESSGDSVSDEDGAAMGENGRFFRAAEVRMMAKYIARHTPEEWAMMTGKQRWYPFHKDYPHRSENSYLMKYRSKEQEFLNLAERYRRRAHRQQYGTPSWAKGSGRKPLIRS